LEVAGEPPIPPYIHGYKGDPERYQTVYSKIRGSAAAPTAGLHFSDRLLDELRSRGIILAFVTLHVGLDTFMPVLEDDPRKHKMYSEFCQVSPRTAGLLNAVRGGGGKIIGVGTTSVRTLESAYSAGQIRPYSDWTSIYILPGYEFKAIDGMITNFHYPKSTNLMMVSAFAGLDRLKEAYRIAVEESYHFYSFGDAMLILKGDAG
jgi:S-adenosylmethionine:tRNA ribosyltransferase-isomerase